jgi:DNA-binding beta-propeller fold protein YncE/mono/diheme cytochrome c family protein
MGPPLGAVLAFLVLAGCGGAHPGVAPRDAKPRAGSRCLDAASALKPLDRSGAGSAVALARAEGKTLAFVADEDDRALHVVDVDRKRRLSSFDLGGRPGQVLVSEDGSVIATNADRSQLVVLGFEGSELLARCSVDLPAEPVAIASNRTREELVVLSRWGRTLTVIDSRRMEPRLSVELARDPSAVALSQDGRRAFVSHVAGGQLSVVDLDQPRARASTLPVLSAPDPAHAAQRAEVRKSLEKTLPPGPTRDQALRDLDRALDQSSGAQQRTAVQGFALAKSSADQRLFMPQVFVDSGRSEQRTTGYGSGSGASELMSIAVLDTGSGELFPPSLEIRQQQAWEQVDTNEDVCLLPRAAAVDESSDRLFVACAGIDSVIAFDAASAKPATAETRRWRVASGPSGIAVDAERKRLVVWSQFDSTLSTIDLGGENRPPDEDAKTDKPVAELRIEPSPDDRLDPSILLGRLLFHTAGDPRISQDGRACASCHPSGRDDGLTWSTPNGPRRTKMLAGMLEGTAPYSWDGRTEDLEVHLRETFTRLSGSGRLSSLERRALIAYIQALPTPPQPAVSTDAVARGRAVFESATAGCASCHGGNALTNNVVHDVSSRVAADRDAKFDTPSLRFLNSRAPYFHDGRYATLRDLVDAKNDKMGKTSHLSAEERDALVAYLRSL